MTLHVVHLDELLAAVIDGTLEWAILLSQVLDQMVSELPSRGELPVLCSADLALDRTVAAAA